MFFDSIFGLVRIAIVGPLAYVILIIVLRISGKRTLAKMNAFDFVVTVALGSTLATVLLSKDVPLLEGTIGFCVLILLQFVVAWTAQRFPAVEALVKASPCILLSDGVLDHAALLQARVTEDEVGAAVRKGGFGDLALVAAVVLETDGTFSVIGTADAGARSALP